MSMVTKSLRDENLPSSVVTSIEVLFGEESELDLRVANGGRIPFIGWVGVQFHFVVLSFRSRQSISSRLCD